MRNTKVLTVSLTSLFIMGCDTLPPVGIVEQEGFEAFVTPRAFDGPGTIYRIDSTGKRYLVDTLDIKLPPAAEEVIPKYSSQKELSLNQLLESIGAKAEVIPANISANLSSKRNAVIESTGAARLRLSDKLVDAALLKWRNGTSFQEGNKYYLIRETISTPGLKYKVENGWLSSAGIDLKYLQVAGYKGEAKAINTNTLELDTKFNSPMNVWYKVQSISFKPAFGAGGGQITVVKEDAPKGTLGL